MFTDIDKKSDEEIVEIVREKDKELYSLIMRRYQEKLMRYAIFLVKDSDKAMDVVQSSFVKAFVNLNGFNNNKKFSSWIYRIVHNEAMNFIAKSKKETILSEDFDVSSDYDIEKDFEKNETRERIERCLSEMSIIYSEPISLFYIENKSYEEIGDILQIPIGTVATRISRGKLLMKKICQKN